MIPVVFDTVQKRATRPASLVRRFRQTSAQPATQADAIVRGSALPYRPESEAPPMPVPMTTPRIDPPVWTSGEHEAALLKSGALQRAILSSATFPIIATDERGIIQLFNVGAERLLGYPAGEVINRITPSEIQDPEEAKARAIALSAEYGTEIAPGFEALAYKASRGIEDIHELTYIGRDGLPFPALVSITALRGEDDTIIGYLLIGADNTERKRAEAELVAARVLAERASLAKSEFLSSMSHELRTPLGAILGFAQLLESGQPPPSATQGRSIDQILKAGWYLLKLINEVLDLAVVESGTVTLNLEPVSLFEVLYECHAIVEQHARKRAVRVFYPKFDKAHLVRADHTRLKQVLINLLSNAIKYNRHGGTVTVTCCVVDDRLIRIGVQDTGEGLSPSKRDQLFQPFNRLGQESGSEEGTGIGLVLCRRLVELMGGAITVHSEVGVGSCFSIDLALEPDALPDPATASTAVAQRQAPPVSPASDRFIETRRCTLLYIEDIAADVLLVHELVARRSDVGLITATDSTCGIEIARTYRPDLILMNIDRLAASGLRSLRALADDPITARVPVIALTTQSIPAAIEKGLQAGFFRFLAKPIRIDAFMDALDAGIQRNALRLHPTLPVMDSP